MHPIRVYFFVAILLCVLVDFNECKRGGGGRKSGGGRSGGWFSWGRGSTSHSSHTSHTSHSSSNPGHTYGSGGSHYESHASYPTSSHNNPIGWNVQKNTGTGSTYNTGSHGTSVKHDSKPLGSSNVPHKPIGWDLPPRPSSAYQTSNGHHQSGYHPYQQYPSAQGPTKVKVVNKYNYHYPGYYSPPQPSYYSGYYHTPSYYHYSSSDTGNGPLGFALGYHLGRLNTPTYSHYSFYDGYSPRYDHYTVHHYYHNRDSIPRTQEIQPNKITGCVGDTTTICPVNTTSLCTSEGTLMCVVSAASTVPCKDERQVNCIRSEVPCYNSTAPECAGDKNSTIVNIPCISNAMVYGPITYVNNTIIVDVGNGTKNGTAMGINNTTTSTTSTTESPVITETDELYEAAIYDPWARELLSRTKRQANSTAPQNFCVTVVALPAKKKLTEGEKTYDDARNLVAKFFESALGL